MSAFGVHDDHCVPKTTAVVRDCSIVPVHAEMPRVVLCKITKPQLLIALLEKLNPWQASQLHTQHI